MLGSFLLSLFALWPPPGNRRRSYYLDMGKYELAIEYVKPTALKPYKKNARKHGDEDVSAIMQSILDFGFNDPIGVWGESNTIVEGHGRLIAAQKLGMESVPIIHLDHLNDEQRRAYGLAHNRTAELSEWDEAVKEAELKEIVSFDMSEYGFDAYDGDEYEHDQSAITTQDRVENICNLGLGQFDGEGYYDIPKIKPLKEIPEIKEWIGFKYVMSDENPEGKAVHFFVDDYQFERVWNEPEKYLDKLKQYAVVASPDFSPYGDMPLALQIFNHYRKHWVAAYWQYHGIRVIPTIRASTDPRSFDWYLDGEPYGGAVLISSMWTNTEDVMEVFEREYNTMYDTLNPCKVFLYGRMRDGLRGNIEVVPSFSQSRFGKATREDE